MLIFNHLKNTCTQQPRPTGRWTWLRNSHTWCISTSLRSSPRDTRQQPSQGCWGHQSHEPARNVLRLVTSGPAGTTGRKMSDWKHESRKFNSHHYFLEVFFFCSTHQPFMNINHNIGGFTLLNTRCFQFSTTFFTQIIAFWESKPIILTNPISLWGDKKCE